MDTTREHLWGQLLREHNLVESSRLQQLVVERDQRLRSGQDCSIGQLLVQKRVLDIHRFQSLRSEIEGRGRACYTCRRVFLATTRTDALNCPSCGGSSRLPPPQSGRFPAGNGSGHYAAPQIGSGGYPAGSGRHPAGQYQSGSTLRPNYFAAQGYAPPQQPYTPMGGTSAYPTGGHSPVQQGSFLSGGTGYPRPATTASADDDPYSGSGDLLDSGELGVGKRLGNYEIVDELGRGGMGVVYKANPVGQPNNFVAIKVLLAGEFASEKLKKRFKAEADLSSKLDHPNIVPVFDVGEVDGLLFYAMGYVQGQELQDMIRAKSLPIRRGVEILVEVSRAAHHAHQHGVVHRDLKPSNVLIGSDGTPYIMDFGLAKNLEADKGMTKSGVAIGTPYYMPPEQARGSHREMDARSDVYALGAILYEIATRRVPFTAKTQNELLRKIVEEEPPTLRSVRAGVALDLETICLKCLSKEKDDRYDSADDLAEDLERFLAGEPIRARRPAFYKPFLRKIKRNRMQSVVVTLAVLAVVAAGGIIAALQSNYQKQLEVDAEHLAEEERLRKLKEAEDARLRGLEEARLREEGELREKAARAIRSGMGSFSASRSATSYSELLRALERAEEAFTDALGIDQKLSEPPAPATTYRRGLVRRLRCSWDGAHSDFMLASKSSSHRARGHLAAGLIKLRQMGDREQARKLLREATAASDVGDLDENEEHTAAGVAAAYVEFLKDDYDGARSKLTALISQGGLGGLAGEANGALAYFERCAGKPLGDDNHVGRGLRAADKALTANKYRYGFLVDRAILRARANKVPDALKDQRSARNLDVDGPWAELADAQINAMPRGNRARMAKAIDSALAKARRRSALSEASVKAFAFQLQAALKKKDEIEQRNRLIDENKSFRMNFNGGGKASTLVLTLRIKPDAYAVVVRLRGSADDLDLHVGKGRVVDYPLAEFEAASPAADETIVIFRDGTPALKTGSYTVIVRQPPNSRKRVEALFSVEFLSKGDPLPFVWQFPRKILFSTKASRAEAQRIVNFLQKGEVDLFKRAWRGFERQEPLAMLLRVDTFAKAEPKLKLSKAELEEVLPKFDGLQQRYPLYRPMIYGIWASAAAEAGHPTQALKILEKAVKEHPDSIHVRLRLMELYIDTKRPKRALAQIKDVRSKGVPVPVVFELSAGRAQIVTGNTKAGAKRVLSAVVNIGTDPNAALQGISVLITHKCYAEAVQAVNTIAARNPRRTNLRLEAFKALGIAGLGKKAQALGRLKKLLSMVPQPGQKVLLRSAIAELNEMFPD